MSDSNRRDWREICYDVLREKRAERVDELLEELLDALEERACTGARDLPQRDH